MDFYKRIKSWIPVELKRLPWYLFKAPQRTIGVSYSLIVEAKGTLFWLFSRPAHWFSRKLQPVAICTGIKNRTDNYLQYVLPSVLKMQHQDLIELSIFDCGSEDAAFLEEEIRKHWKGKLTFTAEQHSFTRAYSFNRAIDQTESSLFFATDADMSLPADLVAQCNRYVSSRTVWFPICFWLYEHKPAVIKKGNGTWLNIGKGMFASTKEQFDEVGKYDTRYKQWGDEDTNLWLRYYEHGILPIRTRCRGLFHHFHEPAPDARRTGFYK